MPLRGKACRYEVVRNGQAETLLDNDHRTPMLCRSSLDCKR